MSTLQASRALHRLTDDELVWRLRGADGVEASEVLYRRLAPRLWRFGFSRLGDRGLADDLTQETFVRVWRAADRFDPSQGSARTWIFSIAHRVAVDLGRKRRPVTELDERRSPERVGDERRAVDVVMVRQALGQLSEAHRSVLLLGYHGGLTHAEVAALTGLPLGTVKTRTYQALAQLRTIMGSEAS